MGDGGDFRETEGTLVSGRTHDQGQCGSVIDRAAQLVFVIDTDNLRPDHTNRLGVDVS